MIKIEKLVKTYGKKQAYVRALSGIDLNINKGEFLSIMGSSGSGKSTLMNILGCLDKPTSGIYLLNGMDVSKATTDEAAKIRNNNIGFVFQSFFLLPKLTAIQNLELPMLYSGVSKAIRREKAKEVLDMMGLTNRASHFPSELSGGQCQRIAIGRALTNDPNLILADEPTGNLDSVTSLEIMKVLKNLNHSGTTIVLITHEHEIAQHTDRILNLKDGQFIN